MVGVPCCLPRGVHQPEKGQQASVCSGMTSLCQSGGRSSPAAAKYTSNTAAVLTSLMIGSPCCCKPCLRHSGCVNTADNRVHQRIPVPAAAHRAAAGGGAAATPWQRWQPTWQPPGPAAAAVAAAPMHPPARPSVQRSASPAPVLAVSLCPGLWCRCFAVLTEAEASLPAV